MNKLITYILQNLHIFGLPVGPSITAELRTSNHNSKTARNYWLVKVDGNLRIVLQSAITIDGKVCKDNPYEPVFFKDIENFLVSKRGIIEIDNQRLYWSEYIEKPSMMTLLKQETSLKNIDLLYRFSHQLENLQNMYQQTNKTYMDDLIVKIREKINNWILYEKFIAASEFLHQNLYIQPILSTSWSHGDLCPQEIFPLSEDIFKVIDWEWALIHAPIGADLLDLYLSTAEHVFAFDVLTAWNHFLNNTLHKLQALREVIFNIWAKNHFTLNDIRLVLNYTLFRWWAREVAQTGQVASQYTNNYKNISKIINQFSNNDHGIKNNVSLKDSIESIEKIATQVNKDQSSIIISIIIPTLNRAMWLHNTLISLVQQDYSPHFFEILIIDNGSTDNTKEVSEQFINSHKIHNIKYFYEPIPGLLSGRHRGAFEAKGDIFVFIDDDIEVTSEWLASIIEAFNDDSIGLVTGPCIPKFETPPPKWTNLFWQSIQNGKYCGAFSSIYLGKKKCYIDPIFVFGLNYAIRKNVFFDLGGFHPDCIAKHLQMFQGDGETGLSLKAKEKGIKAFYHPDAKVFHNIPSSRLTLKYFKDRFFYQGVCDSYTEIRRNKGVDNIFLPIKNDYSNYYLRETQHSYVDGFLFHYNSVCKNKTLLDWVLRENYFDYKIPEL